MIKQVPQRFYSLDVLRGVAALSVVLWHWQHFFLPLNRQGEKLVMDQQPFFAFLYIFYQYGNIAVQLFFCISGFIFFWLYSQRIADKTITLKKFSILRLSRLYPLHLVTLILVLAGQSAYREITNSCFVYKVNDLYHFVLNFFFISSWGFEQDFSFNGPVWSVSVEILLYTAFFFFCRIFQRNIFALLAAVIAGHTLVARLNVAIATGVECFFLGALIYVAYEKIVKSGDRWKIAGWLPFVTALAWLIAIIGGHPNSIFTLDIAPWIIQKIASYWVVFILFPLAVGSLALLETQRGTLGRRLAFIGDISYSSYLIHFPLQLAAALITASLSIGQSIFYSPWFMLLFFLVLILLSLASYRYFETPMQNYLRRKLK